MEKAAAFAAEAPRNAGEGAAGLSNPKNQAPNKTASFNDQKEGDQQLGSFLEFGFWRLGFGISASRPSGV
jgi:hypothetical protein